MVWYDIQGDVYSFSLVSQAKLGLCAINVIVRSMHTIKVITQ